MKNKFKQYEAIVFAPKWVDKDKKLDLNHPLNVDELVYYLGEIPNVQGHCLVVKYSGEVVSMVHSQDFRKAKESEL